jgi:RHS repeat-associated protein
MAPNARALFATLVLLHCGICGAADETGELTAAATNSAAMQGSQRPRMKAAISQPAQAIVDDGRIISYSPAAAPMELDSGQFGGFFEQASCPDVTGPCGGGAGPLSDGLHLPATTGIFGAGIHLDGEAKQINLQLSYGFDSITFYLDDPASPLISGYQMPYPWCPLPQPPENRRWYVEIDGVLRATSYRCWQAPTDMQVRWGYPWAVTDMYYHASYEGGTLWSASFTLDPVNVLKVSGDGQTVPIMAKTLQPLVVELKTAAGTPVNFPLPGGGWGFTPHTTPPSATITGPSRTAPKIVSIDFLGGNKFGIVAQVDNKQGTYTVSVTHVDAGQNPPVTFTINAVDSVPPEDNPEDEQNNGNDSNDPSQQGQSDESETMQADVQNVKTVMGSCGVVEQVADPINVTNGSTLRMEVDYAQTGLSPIEFVRTYNSRGSVSPLTGDYWTTNYDRAVIPAANGQPLKLRRSDGLLIRYALVGGSYVSDSSFHGTLQQNGTGWRYTDTAGTFEDYDSTGKLTKVTDLRGRTQTLTYTKGVLSKVVANTGESLTFAYTNNQLTSLTDQAGRTWNYVYDNYRNLTAVKQPNSLYRNYFYSDQHNPWLLTGIARGYNTSTDESQADIAWQYDAQGRATASWFNDPVVGQLMRTDVAFESDGTTRTVMDGNNNVASYVTQLVNGRGFVNSIAGPGQATCGNDLTRQFDGAMNVLSKTQAGHVKTYGGYDAKGQYSHLVVGAGTTEAKGTDYVYDPRFFYKPTQVTEPSVVAGKTKITTTTYDVFGNVTQRTISGFRPSVDPLQQPTAITRTWNYQYNGLYHQLSQVDGPRTDVADVITLAYDATGRLLKVTDPNGIVLRNNITYTKTGNVSAEDRPNGLHIAYSYETGSDLLHSVTQTQGASTRTTTWLHDLKDHVTSITFSDGVNKDQQVNFGYNGAGQLSYVASEAGTIRYTFDGQGNPVRDSYRTGSGTEQSYVQRTFDAYNRLDKLIGANNTIDYDFYPDGTLTQAKDGRQQVTKRFYDGLKRLTRIVRPDASQIQYLYDAGGNLDQVIDPNGGTTSYVFDDFHEKVVQISPDTGTTQFNYDAAGNRSRMTDANGRVTNYTYDAGNRLKTVDRVGSAYDETYTYDNCMNGSGLLCSVVNGSGETVAYAYDGFGGVRTMTTGGKSVGYQYDAQGHIVSTTYPSGRTVGYVYNGGGQITKVTVTENGNVVTLASNIIYKPFGPPLSWTYGNGLTHTQTYDQQNWLRSVATPGVSSLAYTTYDGNGNIKNMSVDGTAQAFGYDAFDELQTASGEFGTRSYHYDSVGNRTSSVIDGNNSTYAYEPNSNRISSQTAWTYQLDPAANTMRKTATDGSGAGYQYQYESNNRLSAVYSLLAPSVPLATYTYNALGQRVLKHVNGTVTRYVYGSDGKLLAEVGAAGDIVQEYVYFNGAPLALLGVPQTGTPLAYDVTLDTSATSPIAWTVKSDSLATNGTYYYQAMNKAIQTVAYWDFHIPSAGNYDLYVHWMGAGASGVVYTYWNGNGWTNVGVSSTQTKGAWIKLGNFHFTADGPGFRLDAQQNTVSSKAYLTADSARLVLTSADAPPNQNYQFVHTDQVGAPRAITDANRTVIWKAAYDPFGRATINDDVADAGTHTTLNLRFPGQYYDAESGLHQNGFRDYDPSTGRYIESDPIGLGGGQNTYAYAMGDPLLRFDPYGLHSPPDFSGPCWTPTGACIPPGPALDQWSKNEGNDVALLVYGPGAGALVAAGAGAAAGYAGSTLVAHVAATAIAVGSDNAEFLLAKSGQEAAEVAEQMGKEWIQETFLEVEIPPSLREFVTSLKGLLPLIGFLAPDDSRAGSADPCP